MAVFRYTAGSNYNSSDYIDLVQHVGNQKLEIIADGSKSVVLGPANLIGDPSNNMYLYTLNGVGQYFGARGYQNNLLYENTGGYYFDYSSGSAAATFVGGNWGDVLVGGGSSDTLRGGAGNDTLTGGASSDTLDGGADNDTLTGGAGSDTLDGGAGTDIAVYSGARLDYRIVQNPNGTVTITDRRGGSPDATDTLSNIETLRFSDGDRSVAAAVANNAPTIAAGSPATTLEDTALVFSTAGGNPVTVSDVDGGNLTVKLTAANGTLTLATTAGLTVGRNGTGEVTLVGPVAAINAALNGMSYRSNSNFNGSDQITVTATDDTSRTTTGSISITVTSVKDAPVASGTATLAAVDEDTAAPVGQSVSALFGPTFSDADGDSLAGVMIMANNANAAQGVWQVFTGGVWADLPPISPTDTYLVSATDSLRFLPAANFAGAVPGIVVRLIDNSAGAVTTGTRVNSDSVGAGGTTPYSVTSVSLNTTVTAVDDASVAVDDAFSTDEATAIGVGLNVFNANPTSPDSDIDSTLTIVAVNGNSIAVGNQITLTSGAVLTLNSDGTFSYAPNQAFDYLPGPASGATNLTRTDSFTYTLIGGDTATVTVTVAGRDSDGDVLLGDSDDNTLNGGIGADQMTGGLGNDIFLVDNVADKVFEAAGQGTDTVHASVSYALAAGAEFEVLSTTNAAGVAAINLTGNQFAQKIDGNNGNNGISGGGGNDTISGYGGNDILDGDTGNDRLEGGAGNDIYVIDGGDTIVEAANAGNDTVQSSVNYTLGSNLENLTLTGAALVATGNTLANVIVGNALGNTLNGGGGNDRLEGGAGNDIYVIDGGDTIVEAANAGNDTVQSSVNYTLGSNLENLTLTGAALVATGNTLANVIVGNALGNTLSGGGGADHLVGGAGNDTYVTDGGDVIYEAANQGTDSVLSSANHTLAANVENLTLIGSALLGVGNTLANVIIGNSLANTLNGGGGADRLVGGAGNDIYVTDGGDTIIEAANAGTDTVRSSVNYTLGSSLENLTLTGAALVATGNTLANVITGNALGNTLNGGGGADRLAGGTGNDTYVTDGGDVIYEAANQGTDSVLSSANHTLAANVENLTLTGNALVGAGNTLNNVITGNALGNTLNGSSGADRLVGGAGNDTYYADNLRDVVVETAGQGIDRVISSVNHILAANVENLTLTGTAASATGNTLGNVIVGTVGKNVLAGGLGNDTLAGGAGADTFLFNTALNKTTNVDRITDFNVAQDTIQLENAVFKGLANGWLAASAFHTGMAAADTLDRVIYNKATGAILFDADGSGRGAAIQFATVTAGLSLTHLDFQVI